MRVKMLALLAASLFLATAWGCGSNMESDGSSTVPPSGIEGGQVQGSSSCKVCHSLAHTSFDSPLVGQVAPNSLVIVHECEACHGPGQFHFGVGPIPHPRPDLNRCAVCHENPVEGALVQDKHVFVNNFGQNEPNCLACHEPLKAAKVEFEGNISCSKCHNAELTSAQLAEKPFASEIYERFAGSRHANQAARSQFCSACHSHEGFLNHVALGKFSNRGELVAAYTAETAPAFMLPVASSTVVGVNKKNCATCHDPHAAALRGLGDLLASPANTLGFPVEAGTPVGTGSGQAEVRVAYSAEFNLCTACHQVELDATWDATAGYGGRGMIRYQLSEAYAIEGLLSAATGTYDWTRVAYHSDSPNTRKFVDTHFAGTIASHIVNMDAGTENVTLVGYNVNPGDRNSCTVCHDPHAGNKMLSLFAGGSTVDGEYRDVLDNDVVKYAQGIGQTHANYLDDQFSRNQASSSCTPCHTGRDFVKLTHGAELADLGGPRWNTLGCISCHDLAKVPVTPFNSSTSQTDNAPALREVRTFPADHAFVFDSEADVSDAFDPLTGRASMVTSQICFECHKGRSGVKADADTTTHVYNINYLHYSPAFATLFGVESGMHPIYEGEEYVGQFMHRGGNATNAAGYSCSECHEVHSAKPKWPVVHGGTGTCGGCHASEDPTNNRSPIYLKARTKAFADRLFATILAKRQEIMPTETAETLKTRINARYNSNNPAASDMGSNALAKAGAVWKNFYYDDPAAWAHNSTFARQVMYDAILSLGGDVSGLNTGVAGGSHADTPDTGRPFVPVTE